MFILIYTCILLFFIFLNIFCDINYFIRTLFTVLSGRLYQRKYTLTETTTIYGICTFLDCDVSFKHIRMAKLLRELDFARYHFYERTGIFQRSRMLSISSLQGCTLTMTEEPVPLFGPYKINTKLVYWDDKSLFLEHEVITLLDGKLRSFLLSRQHAIGEYSQPAKELLEGLPGSEPKPSCPKYIEHWLRSMEITSYKLRASNKS